MRKSMRFLMGCSVFAMMPVLANAAGTYYNGNTYQPAQARYGQSASYVTNSTTTPYVRPTGYTTSGYSSVRYNNPNANVVAQRQTQVQTQTVKSSSSKASGGIKNGFYLNGGISHENAMWEMEMKESASKLHYDNVAWNVLDLDGKYVFSMGNVKGQVEAGFKYGMQWGESSMVDDDITNGGFFITQWVEKDSAGNITKVFGEQIGHALSVGTSDGGSMLGFNVGFGLPGVMQWGNLKITPSVGYRYLKYKLETKKNYGMSVDTAACFTVPGSDEIQCDPIVTLYNTDGNGNISGTPQVVWRDDINDNMKIYSGYEYIDTAGTYYYQQPGTSHSYEVAWSGPYLALDMLYDINENNAIDARVELGLPGYSAEGDQPYRFDWQHPKSVSDSVGMFGAFHLGLGANWTTAISNNVSLSVGVTYDYYNVSGADAETYLNGTYYTDEYVKRLKKYYGSNVDVGSDPWAFPASEMLSNDDTAVALKELKENCSGWVCKVGGEIDSFYRSLGVRVGLNARF